MSWCIHDDIWVPSCVPRSEKKVHQMKYYGVLYHVQNFPGIFKLRITDEVLFKHGRPGGGHIGDCLLQPVYNTLVAIYEGTFGAKFCHEKSVFWRADFWYSNQINGKLWKNDICIQCSLRHGQYYYAESKVLISFINFKLKTFYF